MNRNSIGCLHVRRFLPWILGVALLIALFGILMFPTKPAGRVAAHFLGYRMSTNGYLVAQFSITNGNSFPVRCRFWLTPPHTTEFKSQAMFDPEYEVIPAGIAFRLEGAARPRFPLHSTHPRGTNLPAADWVLRINVWDARPSETASPVRHVVSKFLIDAGLTRLSWLISPSAASVAATDTISPAEQGVE